MNLQMKDEYNEMVIENQRIPYPLNIFYDQGTEEGPDFEELTSIEMPEPQRSLLCHTNDMTPTLEKYFAETAHLYLLDRKSVDGFLFRHIALVDKDDNPMEVGAIKINIAKFPPQAQKLINESFIPMGTIYKMFSIQHINKPESYYRVKSDETINKLFKLNEPTILYCRVNRQVNTNDDLLSLALEILPPVSREVD